MSISGSWTMATASDSRWRMPSGRSKARCSRYSSRPNHSTSSAMRAFALCARQMVEMRVKIEVLPDGQFGIERERLRHVADAIARTACRRLRAARRTAAPRLRSAGSKPVSIFIVVVLPQPFEPTKPKISPRSMVKLTWSTAVKSPKRQVRSRAAMTGSPSKARRGRYAQPLVAARACSGSSAMNASSSVAAPAARLESRRGIRSPAPCPRSSPPASRTARLPPYRRWRPSRSCPGGASASDRSAPRTGGAKADRRRWSARRGSEDRDRG